MIFLLRKDVRYFIKNICLVQSGASSSLKIHILNMFVFFSFLEQKSNDDQLDVLWKHYLKVNARYSEVDGQIQSKIESVVSDG